MKKQSFFILLVSIICVSISISSCKKAGCTDPLAVNYSIEAEEDDGTCTFPADLFVGNWETTEIVDNDSVVYASVISKTDNTNILISSTRSNPPVYFLQTNPITVDWTGKTLDRGGSTVSGIITDENYFELSYLYGTGTQLFSVKQIFRRQ